MEIISGEEQITITQKQLKSIVKDVAKSANAVNLIYALDTKPGITRIRKGSKFEYYYKTKKIKDDEELLRIKHLVIPPAWENVWICPKENGHLQSTGWDVKHRKQYKYHPLWNTLRNHTKFYRLHEFGKALPSIRAQIEKHIKLSQLPLEKVLATVVSLMERTHIRIGNSFYEKIYGSFGLTTLKDKHVIINGTNDIVSHHLGNTRTVCKKYYVHPTIISLYESKELDKYIKQLDTVEKYDKNTLTPEEKIVMKILESNQ